MKNQTTSTSVLSDQSFFDDTSVSGSSMGRKLLFRKTNQSTATRRSLSRRSSQKSQEKEEVSSFYIKMSSLQLTSHQSQTSTRGNFLQREEIGKEKRRSPTPNPGYLSRKRQKQKQKEKQYADNQNDLMLVQLQTKYSSEREKAKVQQRRIEHLERDIKTKICKIDELDDLLVRSEQRAKDFEKKMKQFESIAVDSETSLTQTKTKMERLKNTIKINRYSQLQTDNAKLRKEKEKMIKKVAQVEADNQQLDSRCIFLEKEIYKLKKRREQPSFSRDHNGQNENCLQTVLLSRDQYTKKLESKVAKLEIQITFLNRKKLEQIEQWKEKKNEEMNRLRQRMVNMSKELKQYQMQNQKLKEDPELPLVPKLLTSRTTIMSSNQWANHEEIFSLSLSPEHFQV